VREIGFSTLSRDIYSFVLVDANVDGADPYYQEVRNQLNDINIRFAVLHPNKDVAHPFMKQILENSIPLPAKVLIAPDGRMLVLNEYNLMDALNILKVSPLREKVRCEFIDVFAVVLWFEGDNTQKNRVVEAEMFSNCEQISNIMAHMPKEVKKKPLVIRVSKDDFQKEKILMWALGVDEKFTEPKAFVLYGRGRIMGDAISSASILEGNLFKLMSMIGADCECGLNRNWMLGNQIPLMWPQETRQELTNELGFDVDNPMILAEMSRILAKEVNVEQAEGISYGPESIDLNKAFNKLPKIPYEEETKSGIVPMWSWYLIAFLVFILAFGIFLFLRNLNK